MTVLVLLLLSGVLAAAAEKAPLLTHSDHIQGQYIVKFKVRPFLLALCVCFDCELARSASTAAVIRQKNVTRNIGIFLLKTYSG